MFFFDLSAILLDPLSNALPFYLNRVVKSWLYVLMKLAVVKFLEFLL